MTTRAAWRADFPDVDAWPGDLPRSLAAHTERMALLAARAGGRLERDALDLVAARVRRGHEPHTTLVLGETRAGWVVANLARAWDLEVLPALTRGDVGVGDIDGFRAWLAGADRATLLADAADLGVPVAALGAPRSPARAVEGPRSFAPRPAADARVLDLARLWAGPLATGLLAEAGAHVIRVEDPSAPDPTATSDPALYGDLNGAKDVHRIPFGDPALLDEVAAADVVVTSSRPRALARVAAAVRPDALWLRITAYGPDDPRVGFGDDIAMAAGAVVWDAGHPRPIADALADPLAGIAGATAVLGALVDGSPGIVDVPMADVVARHLASDPPAGRDL